MLPAIKQQVSGESADVIEKSFPGDSAFTDLRVLSAIARLAWVFDSRNHSL